jgi:putative peptide zinc metalloprotease protein
MSDTLVRTDRPMRRDGVVVHPAADPAQPWVVEVEEGRYLRLGRDAGMLLDRLDGSGDAETVAAGLGAPWTGALVQTMVERFRAAGLLAGSEPARPHATGTDTTAIRTTPLRRTSSGRIARFQYRPPASLQLTVVNPDPFLARHRALWQRLTGRAAAAVAVAIAILGLFVLAAQSDVVATALAQPLSPSTLTATLAAFVFVVSLHELAHAATLAAAGGRVRRVGVMLLYLSPALFCDVSDGWRLGERRDRMRVALAGGTANVAIAGLVAVVSLAAGGTVRTVLVMVAVSSYLAAVVNLLPLVKFDGYIALMSALDIPHLRARAMADNRRAVARIVFGGRPGTAELPDLWWSPLYGLGCAIAPLVIVGLAVWNLALAVSGWGSAGAAARLVMAALVAAFVLRRIATLAALARAGGASRVRMVAGATAAAAAIAAVLTFLPVPDVVSGGYVRTGDRTEFVASSSLDASRLRTGQVVTLERQGLVSRQAVGAARVAASGVTTVTAPLQAIVPFVRAATPARAHAVALEGTTFTSPAGKVGAASVRIGTTSPVAWLARAFVTDPVRILTGHTKEHS